MGLAGLARACRDRGKTEDLHRVAPEDLVGRVVRWPCGFSPGEIEGEAAFEEEPGHGRAQWHRPSRSGERPLMLFEEGSVVECPHLFPVLVR